MLANYSVKKPYTVVVAIVLVLILGVISFQNMSTDLLPSMNLPYVVVYTTNVGETAENIEESITRPMESAFASLTGLKQMISTSSDNVSTLIMEFDENVDMNSIMIDLSTQIDLLRGNWDDSVSAPVVMKLNPDMLPVSIVSVSMDGMDIVELSAFVEELAAEYESVAGVASATASGLVKQSVQITLSQERIDALNSAILREIDAELADVEQQLRDAQRELDSARGQLSGQKSSALGQIDDALEQIDQGQAQLDQAIAQLEAQRSELQAQLDQVNAGLEQFSSIGDLSIEEIQAIVDAGVRHAALQQQLQQLQSQLENLSQQDTSALQQQIDALNAQKQELIAQREAYVAYIADLQAMNPDALREEIAQCDAQIGEKQAALEESSARLEAKRAEMETVAAKMAALEPESEEYLALEQQKAQLEQEAAAIEAEKAGLEEEISALTVRRDGMQDTLTALEQEGIASGEAVQAKIDEAQRQVDAIDVEIAALDGQIAQLQAQLDEDTSRQQQELEAQIADVQAQMAEIEATEAWQKLQGFSNIDQIASQYVQLLMAKQQLEEGIAQIDQTLETLKSGVIPGGMVEGIDQDTNLADARKQLEEAREQAVQGFAQGESVIRDGQAQLDQAWTEFEKSRDEALKQANLDGIVTLETVGSILGAQDFGMPAGYLRAGNDSYLVSVGNEIANIDELKRLRLFDLGMESVGVVRLMDVAVVELQDDRQDGFTRVDGLDGILLSFDKQSTYSTADVGHAIREKTEELMAKYDGLKVVDMINQGDYIDIVIDSVLSNLLMGGLLAVLVLLIFLMDIRPTLIVALSIPVSVVAAFVCMYFSGVTLNVLSLSGLALGIGMLVDNSIVSIENIYRLHNDEGMPVLKSCVEGVRQVSGSLIASTLTTICVFVPILFVTGLARSLFSDLGLTIAFSLVASLVVAMTFVPSMSAAVLRKAKVRKHRFFDAVQNGYAVLLRGALKGKPLVLLAAIGLLAYAVTQVGSMGISFMPSVNSTQMSAALSFENDEDTDMRRALATELMQRVMEVDSVESVGVTESAGMMSMLNGGGDSSMSYYITLREDSGRKNAEIAREISQIGDEMGLSLEVSASTMDISMMTGSGISVDILGKDIAEMQRVASDVAEIAAKLPGVESVDDGSQDSVPELRVVVDKDKAMENGLTVAQVYMALATELHGSTQLMEIPQDGREIDVYIADDRLGNMTPDRLADMTIAAQITQRNDQGQMETQDRDVRLGDIARVEKTVSSSSIRRENQQRMTSVSVAVADGYAINAVSGALEDALADYPLPEDCEIVFSGENEVVMGIMEDLVWMVVVALAFIFLIMVAQFQSLRSPLIVMFTIPLAFTGGLLALVITGMDLSVVSMVGFLVLSGVVVNNGIVFVDCVNQLRIGGMTKREALIQTGRMRLRPILMTALTTILGMLLMALGTGMGSEMMQPMAVVTIGGLLYATLMTLFVVPAMYDIFNGEKMKAREIDMRKENESAGQDALPE